MRTVNLQRRTRMFWRDIRVWHVDKLNARIGPLSVMEYNRSSLVCHGHISRPTAACILLCCNISAQYTQFLDWWRCSHRSTQHEEPINAVLWHTARSLGKPHHQRKYASTKVCVLLPLWRLCKNNWIILLGSNIPLYQMTKVVYGYGEVKGKIVARSIRFP